MMREMLLVWLKGFLNIHLFAPSFFYLFFSFDIFYKVVKVFAMKRATFGTFLIEFVIHFFISFSLHVSYMDKQNISHLSRNIFIWRKRVHIEIFIWLMIRNWYISFTYRFERDIKGNDFTNQARSQWMTIKSKYYDRSFFS